MPRTKKEKPKGEYRNLKLTEGTNLYEFEVKLKGDKWHRFTNLCVESIKDAEVFAQNTAEAWKNK